uniref:triacylglycerol lipase n=1 Tax=Kurtzmanomyces sp. I-11 TaxID=176846 RepID=Q8NIP2_9BASI|nr:lipase [Kurtzmanomyces sp. I-11]
MRFFLRAVLGLAVTATAALAAPLEPRAALPDPNEDPFYSTPSNIETFANGQIIQSRKVPTDIGNSNNAASYQLSYRTTNTQEDAVANVATIWIPAKPSSPPRIFTYQVYEDSTQLDCAPSYSYLTGYDQPNKATAVLDTPIVISWALQQGYYVVSADHEGARSAFIAGYEEGMAALDGIRALRNYAKLPQDSAVGAYGYSGGAHATVWATSLAAAYAPEINFIGAAHGGTPVSAKDTFTFINGGFFAGFAIAGVSGLANAHPDMEAFIQPRLNAEGVKTLKQIRSRGFCLPEVVTTYPFKNVFALVNDTNLLTEQPISGILQQETLVQSEASYAVPVPKFPRFLWHAALDEIVPYVPVTEYVKEQCAKGANINFNTYPIAEHLTAEIFGLVPGLWFLSQAYEGKAPAVQCGTALPAAPSAQQVLGNDLANQLSSLNGKQSPFGKPFGPISPTSLDKLL